MNNIKLKRENILYLLTLLSLGYSSYFFVTWLSNFKLEPGEYSTTEQVSGSVVKTKIDLTVDTDSLLIAFDFSRPYCEGVKVKMKYQYSQALLARYITLYNGSLISDQKHLDCRGMIMGTIGDELGFGNKITVDVVKDNKGNVCFRNNNFGLYCFAKNKISI